MIIYLKLKPLMKTLIKSLFIFTIALFIVSCNDDDGGGATPSPTLSYSDTNLEASFYTPDSSPSPNINWNGNQGSLSIDTSIEGLSINTSTGQINWTKMLPLGTHNFSVVASNSSGQTSVPITIENDFEGNFTGAYNGSVYFAADFSDDGTVAIHVNNESDPDLGHGTWERNGDEITADYTYDEAQDDYSFRLTINQTASTASLDGNWYYGHGVNSGSEGGVLELEIE